MNTGSITDSVQAMESSCHTGQTILYDTVTVKGWSVDVRTHRIGEIINKILADPWPTEGGGDGDHSGDGDHKGKGARWWLPWTSRKVQADKMTAQKWRWGWGRKGPKDGEGGDPDDEGDDDDWNKHGGVPKAETESNCTDCYRW